MFEVFRKKTGYARLNHVSLGKNWPKWLKIMDKGRNMAIRKNLAMAPCISFLAACLFSVSVQADTVANFYKGKTVTIIVAAKAGGGHHKWSLFLSPYWEKYMPGNPNFITQNMGGAGGTKAANYLYNRSSQDGTAIGILLQDTPFAARLRKTGIKYDPQRFQFIGGAERPQPAFVALKEAGVKSLEDVKKKQVIIGSSGKGSQTYILPKLANGMIGTKFKIVTGYRGMAGIYKAMESKEVYAFQAGYSSVALIRPHWIDQKRIEVLAVNSLKPLPGWENKKLFKDYVTDPTDKKIVELIAGNDIIGRAWLAPPGVPKARLEALRASFKAIFSDEDALANAKKRKMDFGYVDWRGQQEHATNLSTAHDKLFDRVRYLMSLKN